MKPAALEYLACTACGGSLVANSHTLDGEEIIEGTLVCAACSEAYPIVRGVPRFAGELGKAEADTAAAFGYEWTRYRELAARYRQQFLDWIRPVEPAFLAGKTVLEGGCGKGRHTAVVAELGARAVVAMDLSDAVDAAFDNTRRLENVHVVQADLNHPPVRRAFDYAFSIGCSTTHRIRNAAFARWSIGCCRAVRSRRGCTGGKGTAGSCTSSPRCGSA